jgi:magnesium chelatase family protein
MVGPPGSGKTMLSRRFSQILPELTMEESIETTRVHSVSGALSKGIALLRSRPFRSPHHTISEAGLVGGGSIPKPGEVSLAHNGVLFLDELPEFSRKTLEVLRQPLEDGFVTIGRAQATITYPARFTLIAAMNPCPCGYWGSTSKPCHCTPPQIQKYRSKISGPLLDRIDMHIEVPVVKTQELFSKREGTTSQEMRVLVHKAREMALVRFKEEAKPIFCNAQMSGKLLRKNCKLSNEVESYLREAIEELGMSTRGYVRILRVARTIADIDASIDIKINHIAEALQYRSLDRGILI